MFGNGVNVTTEFLAASPDLVLKKVFHFQNLLQDTVPDRVWTFHSEAQT